jgi:MarR family transcriptional regulator, organic hydroperoxide resistance regulator
MTGYHTLSQTMEAVDLRTDGMALDFEAMRAVSNIHRAATAIRNHLEHSVLKSAGLTWTAFVVLWVVWTWKELETRHVASEAGITKATLSGVAQTLAKRGLIRRVIPAHDRRQALLSLTSEGEALMERLFPAFNEEERYVTSCLKAAAVSELGESLGSIIEHLERTSHDRQQHTQPIHT